MQNTPKGFRVHIGLFGRRNVGKSSLLNAITKQEVSIVSAVAGTTTDPIEKPMEILPLGPVLFIDTAGVDDVGTLGALRVEKTRKIFDRVDLGIILTENNVWGEFEEQLLIELENRRVPLIIAFNKIDLYPVDNIILNNVANKQYAHGYKVVAMSTKNQKSIDDFRETLLSVANSSVDHNVILRDLVGAGELAILVTPIDKEAPKGRLILPEVQAIRDVLDGDAYCIVTQQNRLKEALQSLNKPPKLVVTDSQCFAEVAQITPENIPLTSFSILFSRLKGDLVRQAVGATAINKLAMQDKVLICEACTHHPICDDIGREKIPKLLQKKAGKPLEIQVVSGHSFPTDLSMYKLVVHCGACMWNRREVLSRISHSNNLGIPFTNYGMAIAHCLGILPRALQSFPEAAMAYNKAL